MTGRGRANKIDIHVGHRLRLRRTSIGVSQEELGRALGLTFQQVQKFEAGSNRISASYLFGIAKALRVPVSYFFHEAGQPSPFEELPGALRKFAMSNEGLSLWRAYSRIEGKSVRRSVVDLVKAMAESA